LTTEVEELKLSVAELKDAAPIEAVEETAEKKSSKKSKKSAE
jgi:hypothetical protein